MIDSIDHAGASARDVRPYFPIPWRTLPCPDENLMQWNRSSDLSQQIRQWIGMCSSGDADCLGTILHKVAGLVAWTEHLSSAYHDIWADPGLLQKYITPVMHECLSLAPQRGNLYAAMDTDGPLDLTSQERRLAMQEALRHSIVLFVDPLYRKFNAATRGTELRLRKLLHTLRICFDSWTHARLLLLWIMVVGGTESHAASYRDRFATLIARCICDHQSSPVVDPRAEVLRILAITTWYTSTTESSFQQLMISVETETKSINNHTLDLEH
jgi:hypothetical protein